MLTLLPISCAIVLVLAFQKSSVTSDWRASILHAAVVWGMLLTFITEFLSYFTLIADRGVLFFWLLSTVFALIYLIQKDGDTTKLSAFFGIRQAKHPLFLLVATIILITLAIGSIAWIAPPNNWDSMTYHLSRVAHWVQNKSLVNYPTHIPRQLYQNPWAEFAILHFKLLSGGDRWANMTQWFAMGASVLGVSLLAKQLGANVRGQVLAAVTCVTIPMGVLQGSSTQNDYVVSFWLVCLTHYLLLLKKDFIPLHALAVGASLGLAILTKGSAYIYAFPLMAWLSFSLLKSRQGYGLILVLFMVTPAVVLNMGHYKRNYELFGNPLGPGQEGESFKFSNDVYNLSSLGSNTIRNLGLHLGTPSFRLNAELDAGIYRLHKLIGISPNDPRTTWAGTAFHVPAIYLFEDSAGNPLHLALIIFSLLFLFVTSRKHTDLVFFQLCLVCAFILFSLYLKWQPWNSRLHLPLFVLWSSLIGLSLSQVRTNWLANIVVLLMLLGAVPYLLKNQARPLIGDDNILTLSRTDLYFKSQPLLAKPYAQAARMIIDSPCSNVGLMLREDDWEYPFWILLAGNQNRPIRIEHVNVSNLSKAQYDKSQFRSFKPCAVAVLNEQPPDDLQLDNETYARVWRSGLVSLFVPKTGLNSLPEVK